MIASLYHLSFSANSVSVVRIMHPNHSNFFLTMNDTDNYMVMVSKFLLVDADNLIRLCKRKTTTATAIMRSRSLRIKTVFKRMLDGSDYQASFKKSRLTNGGLGKKTADLRKKQCTFRTRILRRVQLYVTIVLNFIQLLV